MLLVSGTWGTWVWLCLFYVPLEPTSVNNVTKAGINSSSLLWFAWLELRPNSLLILLWTIYPLCLTPSLTDCSLPWMGSITFTLAQNINYRQVCGNENTYAIESKLLPSPFCLLSFFLSFCLFSMCETAHRKQVVYVRQMDISFCCLLKWNTINIYWLVKFLSISFTLLVSLIRINFSHIFLPLISPPHLFAFLVYVDVCTVVVLINVCVRDIEL